MKEKVSQLATIFSAFGGCLLLRSTDFYPSWINWICWSISLLLIEVSVIIHHRDHNPSCLFPLYGLRQKWQKEKFCHRLMDYDVFRFQHVSVLIHS